MHADIESVSHPPAPKRSSASRHIHERFLRHRLRRTLVAYSYMALFFVYLVWRATILNPESMTLSVVYFAAECICFILCLTTIATSRHYQHHVPPPGLKGRTVDVFVPTYKEPIEIIRRTVMAASAIDYPHRTVVLDDGRREEVKALAAELGVHYLSRPKNLHAKAGNLNYGLAHSEAEFVMVFDADHIAMPHGLDVTLGFFADAAVGMVQTPQDYYNVDAFQYINSSRGGLWHDQSFFYNIAQPCRDAVNGASCVGTGVVYRRSALDKIGGIPTTTVTEDVHTSLRMHKAGYRVINLNEPIAYGIAAVDLGEYYKTRHRWAHGNLHALQHENVLFCKGLTPAQRLSYLSLGLIYLEGWQQLMLFAIPIGALLFGMPPFEISVFNALVILLFPFLNYALLQEIGCGFARFWTNEIFSMARWPVHLVASSGLFGWRIRWRTSRKKVRGGMRWSLMAPQLAILVASVGAVIFGYLRLAGNYTLGPVFQVLSAVAKGAPLSHIDWFAVLPPGYTLDLVAIAGFWALYNTLRATVFIVKALRNAKQAQPFFRFEVPLPVMSGNQYGRTAWVSESQVRLTLFDYPGALRPGDRIPLTLFLPAGPLTARLEVRKVHGNRVHAAECEGAFLWDSDAQRDQLACCIYSVDWHREMRVRYEYFNTPLDMLASLLRPDPHRQPSAPWWPVLYHHRTDSYTPLKYGVIRQHAQGADFITFRYLTPGQICEGWQMAGDTAQPVRICILDEQSVASLVQKGLDQAVVRRYAVQILPVAQMQQQESRQPREVGMTVEIH